VGFPALLIDVVDHGRWLLQRATGQRGANLLLAELGCELDVDAAINVSAAIDALADLVRKVAELQAASGDAQTLAKFLEMGEKAVTAVSAVTQLGQDLATLGQVTSEGANLAASDLAKRLVDRIVAEYLQGNVRSIYAFLRTLGIIEIRTVGISNSLQQRRFVEIHWPELWKSLSDPKTLLDGAYDWGKSTFRYADLVPVIQDVMRELGIPAALYPLNALEAADMGSTWGSHYATAENELALTVLEQSGANGYMHFGLSLHQLQKTTSGTNTFGVALIPKLLGEAATSIPIGSNTALTLQADLAGSMSIEIWPDKIEMVPPVGREPIAARGAIRVSLAPRDLSIGGLAIEVPALAVLEIAHFSNVVAAEIDAQRGHDFYWETTLHGCTFKLGSKSGDGFINKVLPADISATFDLQLRLSARDGISFKGSGVLEIPIPVHKQIGPIFLDTLFVSLSLGQGSGIGVTISASLAAAVGPIAVAVEKVGVTTQLQFPGAGGNLGPLNLSRPAFSPPTLVGIGIDASGVSGGAALGHNPATKSYSGIGEIRFSDIGLTAIALIATEIPGGGFALYINIGVVFSPAIQLPYNFNLSGCGGLLALNRTMDVEALRSGLKNHTLDSILFPENPILNATRIISDSERVFPIEKDRFVIGPMAKFGWSAQNIITADVAIVIEVPQPIVIALLGKITAKFPKPENAKCVLHLDVLGVIEFEKKEFAIDASLYDSHIASYDISGDSAMRLNWGTNKWAMSVGGFHPKFSPPPKFPTLGRVKLQLKSSDSFDLSCTAYQALTSNTLQFGAALRLHAEACGVELDGGMSADTLFVFSPFQFTTDIHAHLSAEYKGFDIASVSLGMDLSGPSPWHAKGKAKVSVSRFSTTARFSKTWGSDNAISLPSVNPEPLFIAELGREGNWGSALIPGVVAVEALASPIDKGTTVPATDTTPEQPFLVLHPAGGLQLTQRLLPLDIKLEKFGNADITGHSRFDFRLQLGAATLEITAEDVEDYFARGQFKDLSKSERLSKPSYEKFLAGKNARPSFPGVDGRVEPCPLEYESILFGIDNTASAQQANAAMPWTTFGKTASAAAWRHHALRNRGSVRFSVPGGGPRVGVAEEAYVIVQKATLTRDMEIYADTKPLNQTKAEELLKEYEAANPATAGTAAVVPEFEVQEA
jgi:hypothetical protein